MDLFGLFALLSRRKVVVVPMVLLAIASLFAMYQIAPPTYRSSGSIVLLSPPQPDPVPADAAGGATTTTAVQNPYARFGDLSVVPDILVRVLHSSDVTKRLRARGAKGSLVIGANAAFYHGPIIDFTAESARASDAEHTVSLLMGEARRQLSVLQAEQGADPRYFINVATVVAPSTATAVFSSTLRRLLAVAVIDVLVILFAAMSVEGLARRRTSRRRERWTEEMELDPVAPSIDGPTPSEDVDLRLRSRPLVAASLNGHQHAAAPPAPATPVAPVAPDPRPKPARAPERARVRRDLARVMWALKRRA